jgi:hypothetical protein
VCFSELVKNGKLFVPRHFAEYLGKHFGQVLNVGDKHLAIPMGEKGSTTNVVVVVVGAACLEFELFKTDTLLVANRDRKLRLFTYVVAINNKIAWQLRFSVCRLLTRIG